MRRARLGVSAGTFATCWLLTACGGGATTTPVQATAAADTSALSLSDLNDFLQQARLANDLVMWVPNLPKTPSPTPKQPTDVVVYADWARVESIGLGVIRVVEGGPKGGTADINVGVGELQPVEVERRVDQLTPTLFKHAISGVSLGDVSLAFLARLAAADAVQPKVYEQIRIDLGRAFVKDYSQSGDADSVPAETFALWYNTIKLTFTPVSQDGKALDKPVVTGWDNVKNKPLSTRSVSEWVLAARGR